MDSLILATKRLNSEAVAREDNRSKHKIFEFKSIVCQFSELNAIIPVGNAGLGFDMNGQCDKSLPYS